LEASRISRQSVYEGGKVVNPKYRSPSLPRRYAWYFIINVRS